MHTLLVELENEKAYNLIKELEELHILKILKENVVESFPKLSDKYKGVFSREDADGFMEHTRALRKEWDNT